MAITVLRGSFCSTPVHTIRLEGVFLQSGALDKAERKPNPFVELQSIPMAKRIKLQIENHTVEVDAETLLRAVSTLVK